jgi:hypothetical protein
LIQEHCQWAARPVQEAGRHPEGGGRRDGGDRGPPRQETSGRGRGTKKNVGINFSLHFFTKEICHNRFFAIDFSTYTFVNIFVINFEVDISLFYQIIINF